MGDAAVGTTFGNYKILAFLGRRGGSRVYQAQQLTIRRTVRLTILPESEARKAAFRVRFERELKVLSAVHHRNVLGAIEAGEIDGARFVATEDVADRTVADALSKGNVYAVAEALSIARDIASALGAFEKAGFVHRNVFPGALVCTDAGHAKLAGFSRAKGSEASSSETWFDAEEEDVSCRSPEAVKGKGKLDSRADIYGLGCSLYHMLAGRPPFRGTPAVVLAAHVQRAPLSMQRRRPDVPDAVEAVIMTCLAKSRADRYQHAIEVERAVDALLADVTIAALTTAPSPDETSTKKPGRRRRRA